MNKSSLLFLLLCACLVADAALAPAAEPAVRAAAPGLPVQRDCQGTPIIDLPISTLNRKAPAAFLFFHGDGPFPIRNHPPL